MPWWSMTNWVQVEPLWYPSYCQWLSAGVRVPHKRQYREAVTRGLTVSVLVHAQLGPNSSSNTAGFQSVNSLLRLANDGPSVKSWVDKHVDVCREPLDILDAIIEARKAAEKADHSQKKRFVSQGLLHLCRYWWLMLLGVYFHVVPPQGQTTFRQFYDAHPVLQTLWKELSSGGLSSLRPLGTHADLQDSDEMRQTVTSRSGRILTSGSILKADLFPGLAKRMEENVSGAPNYRRIDVLKGTDMAFSIFGVGMPTLDGGLTGALEKMGAGPNGAKKVIWTSMRSVACYQSALIFAKSALQRGACHLHFQQALRASPVGRSVRERCLHSKKIIFWHFLSKHSMHVCFAQGVRADTVQQMEDSLRNDILREAAAKDGEILIHDEVDDGSGSYVVAGDWLSLTAEDVLTPSEAFERLQRQGYQVDYERLPVT